MKRTNIHHVVAIIWLQLSAEVTAIIYNLVVAYTGHEYLLPDGKTIGSALFGASVILTPWLLVLIASRSSISRLFYESEAVDLPPLNTYRGLLHRIRFLCTEGRLPFAMLPYMLHAAFSTCSITALSGPRVNYWKEYTANHFLLIEIVYPLVSVIMLLRVYFLVKKSRPVQLMKRIGRASEAGYYSYTHRHRGPNPFYKWIKGIVSNSFTKLRK